MNITKKLISTNFRPGRRKPVLGICIHVTEGNAASVDSWFNDPDAEASAHYMVKKDGGINQYVLEVDEAWAQGRVDRPTAQIVLDNPGVNPNAYLISIEHEGSGREELTEPQRKSSTWLIRDIAGRHRLKLDRYRVIGHHEIFRAKTCPGKIDVSRLLADALAGAIGSPYPRAVWSDYFKDYLIVTRYNSDRDWYFVPLASFSAGGGVKANTPLSEMKMHPGND